MKRKSFLFSKIIITWLVLAFWSILLATLMFPYQVFRVFIPKRKPRRFRGYWWSKFFRKTFEHKQTRKFIGASLVLVIMFFETMNNILASGKELETEVVLVEIPKTIVITKTTLKKPLPGVISQGYHSFHKAIDISAPIGTEIRPITEGKIIEVSRGKLGWGNTIVIEHKNHLKSRYAHLKEIKVIEGEIIEKNFVLGTVGMTGWTTGPHLHLEIYQDGQAINPLSVLPSFEPTRLARIK